MTESTASISHNLEFARQMKESEISDRLLSILRGVDTPTVCNAIDVAQGRRGFNRFTRGTMQHSKPGDPATVVQSPVPLVWLLELNPTLGLRSLLPAVVQVAKFIRIPSTLVWERHRPLHFWLPIQ